MLNLVGVDAAHSEVTVTLESDNYEEVISKAAKDMALNEATGKLGLCGIKSMSGPYPVTENGDEISTTDDLVKISRQSKIEKRSLFKYRNSFIVQKSFGF